MLADADPKPAAVVAALVEDIAHPSTRSPLVVVLDDAHLINDRVAWEPVAWLVDHQPTQLHLVITADPPLPLARWRAHGQLGEDATQTQLSSASPRAGSC